MRNLDADKRDLTEEYAALKHNHLRISKDLKSETAKNEELGLELLALVNGRVVLMKEKDAYAAELDKMKSLNTGLKDHMSSAAEGEEAHQKELSELQERIKTMQTEMQGRQQELSQQNLQLEQQKVSLEKELLATLAAGALPSPEEEEDEEGDDDEFEPQDGEKDGPRERDAR